MRIRKDWAGRASARAGRVRLNSLPDRAVHLPVRQREGEPAPLPHLGFRHQHSAVALRGPAAESQTQPHAVKRGVLLLHVEIVVEKAGEALRRDSRAGICDGEKHPASLQPQIHSDRTAAAGELERIGQEMKDQLFQLRRVHRADMAGKGTDKTDLQSQRLGQVCRLVTEIPHELHQVPVLKREGNVL